MKLREVRFQTRRTGEGGRSMIVRKFGKRKGGVRGEEMGGWRGSCKEDCRRGSEGLEMATVVENRGREFTGERTMEGLDSGRRRMVGGKREISPEREMVMMGMEMQGWGRGNREILQGSCSRGGRSWG